MRKSVLICDDDEMMQMLLGVFLKKEDIEIIPVLKGSDLLPVAKQRVPAMILLDMFMPDKDGLTALQELHADPATASIPVVILSATITPDIMGRARASGAKEFVEKPVKPARILEVVRKYAA